MKVMILTNQTRSMLNFWSVLIAHLQAAGHEVLACAPGGDARSEALLAEKGAAFIPYPLERKGLNPLADMKTFRALLRIFRERRPDALFSSTIKPAIYGSLAAKKAGIGKIFAAITGLGYAFEADTPFKKAVRLLVSRLYRSALAGADGVFFQNRDDVAAFEEAKILAPDARIFMTKGTGVDTARFSPAPFAKGAPVFLMIGRLLEAKGLNDFAEAAEILKKRRPEAEFRLLGAEESGPGGVSLERVRAWEEAGLIRYLGESRDVRPHIAESSAVVLPSRREGTPTALMEAMSMGRPCVACDAPGSREVVRDGVNGFLTPLKDPAALAAALEKFIEDPSLGRRMGEAGRKIAVEEFDAGDVAEKLIADMKLEGRRKPAPHESAPDESATRLAGE